MPLATTVVHGPIDLKTSQMYGSAIASEGFVAGDVVKVNLDAYDEYGNPVTSGMCGFHYFLSLHSFKTIIPSNDGSPWLLPFALTSAGDNP